MARKWRSMSHISELTPDKKNARAHNPRNVGMIVNALQEVGAARSIVIDEDGNILAGNATIEAAMEAGIENLQIIEADGETIVAVRRTGLTPEQKKRLAYYDNRTSELATWDSEQVLADLDIGLDLSGILDSLNFDPIDYDKEWEGMPEFEREPLAHRTIRVHFATPEDIGKFAEMMEQSITEKTRYLWYPIRERRDLKSIGYNTTDES